jgi:hypothetical protein
MRPGPVTPTNTFFFCFPFCMGDPYNENSAQRVLGWSISYVLALYAGAANSFLCFVYIHR